MKVLTPKPFVLSLLVTGLCASPALALTTTAPGQSPVTTHQTSPGALPATGKQSTPAASVPSPIPPPHSGEDIRDIRQPRHISSLWPGIAGAAGVLAFLGAAYLGWRWFRRAKLMSFTPAELALSKLEEARRLMDPDQAREYCFATSAIMRAYLEAQFQLQAPRLTTEEFLRELVENGSFLPAGHEELLGNFLEHCDLAKFAGWRYSLPALKDMHQSAVEFVRQSGAVQKQSKAAPVVAPAVPAEAVAQSA